VNLNRIILSLKVKTMLNPLLDNNSDAGKNNKRRELK
jgi:hypothetical protein